MKIGTVKVGDKVTVNDALYTTIYTVQEISPNQLGVKLSYNLPNGTQINSRTFLDVCYIEKPTKRQLENAGGGK